MDSKPSLPRLCSIDDCRSQIKAHGLCPKHYQTARRKGTLPFTPALCFIDSCESINYAQGYCSAHYYSGRHAGTIQIIQVRTFAVCIVEGCESVHFGNGLCSAHYQRLRSKGRLTKIVGDGICTAEGCEAKYHAKGFCKNHYERWRWRNDPAMKEQRRAIARKRGGKGYQKHRFSLWIAQDGKCAICDIIVLPIPSDSHVDHKIPQAAGGTDDLENLEVTCGPCNLWKADKTTEISQLRKERKTMLKNLRDKQRRGLEDKVHRPQDKEAAPSRPNNPRPAGK